MNRGRGWHNDHERHRASAYGISTSKKKRINTSHQEIPLSKWSAIGVVTPKGYITSYPKNKLDEYEHHSFILDEEDMDLWKDYDENMRFVLYGKNVIGLKGKPSLRPFQRRNYQMIKDLSKYLMENGVSPDTALRIDKQKMNSEFEGEEIGKLKDFADGEFDKFV